MHGRGEKSGLIPFLPKILLLTEAYFLFRSGKVPKAFKVIANFKNWEQLLYLTNPEKWSAAAMFQVR